MPSAVHPLGGHQVIERCRDDRAVLGEHLGPARLAEPLGPAAPGRLQRAQPRRVHVRVDQQPPVQHVAPSGDHPARGTPQYPLSGSFPGIPGWYEET
jgi:hypothetical protein